MTLKEHRRAQRIKVNLPTMIEVIAQPQGNLHPNLAAVLDRVEATPDAIGQRLPGSVRDLSTNGAFITGEPLPLLSRLMFRFPVDNFGAVEVVAWCLWRRTQDCTVPDPTGNEVMLPQGFGVLFEAIPLDARVAIHRLVSGSGN